MPKPIPGREKIHIKELFVQRYQQLLGKDYDEFMNYSLSFLRRSIRVNTLKTTVAELKSRLENEWRLTPVPWCSEGFWIQGKRLDIGNLPEHVLGYFHVQEAASMIPPIVLAPQPHDIVLDMCASPGSKTTQIASMMKNKGVLVANDISGDRMKPLGINLQKAGVSNVLITLSKGHRFAETNMSFDKILVDAPCSGTGTIRKSLKTLQIWNPNMIRRLAGTQRTLLDSAYQVLKSGGTLVYSTCSVEPEENEGIIDWFLQRHDTAVLEKIKMQIKTSPTILEFNGHTYSSETKNCLRIWPQDNDTEGFFVAKIRKT